MKQKGFTLIELILTIVLIGIISGVTAKILMTGIDTYSFVTNRKDASQHARVAMERMVDEMILFQWTDVSFMGQSRLSYWDQDGHSSSFKSDTMNGQPVLKRGNDFLAGVLAFLDFDYLRADGSNASFAWQLRRLNIEVSIEALGGYGDITLRTEVFPRNFMYSDFESID